MGNLTPNPKSRHIKMKLTSKDENKKQETAENEDVPVTLNKYKRPNIKKRAPN